MQSTGWKGNCYYTCTRRKEGKRKGKKGARGLERIRFCINVRGTGRDDYPQFPSVDDDDGMDEESGNLSGQEKKKGKKIERRKVK